MKELKRNSINWERRREQLYKIIIENLSPDEAEPILREVNEDVSIGLGPNIYFLLMYSHLLPGKKRKR